MPNITLYHAAPSRSSIVLWMLEELGEPYEVKLVKLSAGENLKPDFLAINPMGKVPTIKHGDTVITESAAICTFLADEYPKAKLNIPVGAPGRGTYLKWLFFGPSCIEPAMVQLATKIEMNPVSAGWGDAQRVFDVLDAALTKGPWILGDAFSAADIAIGSGLNFAVRLFKMAPSRPSFERYIDRCAARPAFQRASVIAAG